MADDSILPLLFLGGAGYLLWKHYQQTPATSPAIATPAASLFSLITSPSSSLYSPLAEQTAPQAIPPPTPALQSYAAAPGANSANSGPSSPLALFNQGTTTTWGDPGANAPDPSIYRASAASVAAANAAIDATAHAANVAEGPGSIDLSCYTKCYTTWGNLIPGCVCADGSIPGAF